jgi:hypothetical protein
VGDVAAGGADEGKADEAVVGSLQVREVVVGAHSRVKQTYGRYSVRFGHGGPSNRHQKVFVDC